MDCIIVMVYEVCLSNFYPFCLYFYPQARPEELLNVAKNAVHPKAPLHWHRFPTIHVIPPVKHRDMRLEGIHFCRVR